MKTDTSRRSILTGTAAALAGGAAVNLAAIVAAKASEIGLKNNPISDPIFALIERHRTLADEIEAVDHDFEGDDDILKAEVDRLHALEVEIISAQFLTAAGMAAALRFLNSQETEIFSDPDGDAFLNRLADAIEQMGAAS